MLFCDLVKCEYVVFSWLLEDNTLHTGSKECDCGVSKSVCYCGACNPVASLLKTMSVKQSFNCVEPVLGV